MQWKPSVSSNCNCRLAYYHLIIIIISPVVDNRHGISLNCINIIIIIITIIIIIIIINIENRLLSWSSRLPNGGDRWATMRWNRICWRHAVERSPTAASDGETVLTGGASGWRGSGRPHPAYTCLHACMPAIAASGDYSRARSFDKSVVAQSVSSLIGVELSYNIYSRNINICSTELKWDGKKVKYDMITNALARTPFGTFALSEYSLDYMVCNCLDRVLPTANISSRTLRYILSTRRWPIDPLSLKITANAEVDVRRTLLHSVKSINYVWRASSWQHSQHDRCQCRRLSQSVSAAYCNAQCSMTPSKSDACAPRTAL